MSNKKLDHCNNNKDDHNKMNDKTNCFNGSSTPMNRKHIGKHEEESLSPILYRFTQDGGHDDDMEVIWDWNSPRSTKNRAFKCYKRMDVKSPEVSENLNRRRQIPRFSVLKAELEELVNSVNCETNRSNEIATNVTITKSESSEFDDDSLDEEMFKCTQQIEEQLETNVIKIPSPIADDSFDVCFKKIADENIEMSQGEKFESVVNSSRSITRTSSEPYNFCGTLIQQSVFPRTKSMDTNNEILKISLEEIEQKRLKAKARRDICKAERDIEQKRLKALETLQRNRLNRNKNKLSS